MKIVIRTWGLLCLLICGVNYNGYGQKDFATECSRSIDEFGTKTWDQAAYKQLVAKIDFFKKQGRIPEADYPVLLKKLDRVYSDVLVREVNQVMNHTCSSQHNLLRKIEPEVKRMTKVWPSRTDLTDVVKRWDEHQQMAGFVASVRKRQPYPVSVMDKYATDYNSRTLKKMRGYKEKNSSCSYIAGELNRIPAYLNRQHVAFVDSLVNLYVLGETYQEEIEDKVLVQIEAYYYDGDSSGEYKQYGISAKNAQVNREKWIVKMEAFKEKMNSEKPEE